MAPTIGLQMMRGTAGFDVDEPNPFPSPPQQENSQQPVARKRGRPPKGTTAVANKVVKAQRKRTSLGSKAELGAGKRRSVLKDISNSQTAGAAHAEEVDDFDALPKDAAPIAQRASTILTATKMPQKRGRRPKGGKILEEQAGMTGPATKDWEDADSDKEAIPETQQDPKNAVAKIRRRRLVTAGMRQGQAESEPLAEEDEDAMDIDGGNTSQASDADPVDQSSQVIKKRGPGRPPIHKGAGSTVEKDAADSTTRLSRDMTREHEELQAKYDKLVELSVKSGESNFDKLKKQADAKTAAANTLIASLRAELKAQTALASTTQRLQDRISALDASNEAALAEAKTARASLAASQGEIKALQARLAATRSASHPIESAAGRNPGSALKSGVGNGRNLPGNADAAKEAQKRALKEELYSDLTGLIIRDVACNQDEGDIYDLIQTGRNGTLHFHLTVPSTSSNSNHPQAASYDEAEITYTPFLDANRDRDLFTILPDYLIEEISFPRSNLSKCYSRIADCLTKRIVIEDEDDAMVD